jgi:1-deoxy-D-xylulose-5-phosphate reductoisomerase
MIHSMVEYADGSVLAQLGNPDMRTAIAHALAWPERIEAGVAPLDLTACAPLAFEKPDLATFRCLALAFAALREGGDAPAILNAANEVAVDAFLSQRLRFDRIHAVNLATLERVAPARPANLADLLALDAEARAAAQAAVARMAA